MGVICAVLTVYIIVLVGRAILSWLPPPEGPGFHASASRLLHDLTEPVLAPMRRIIPPIGVLDISFMVVVFGFFILLRVLC